MTYTLHHGDCLDILPTLPSGSIDAVIADPPYGTTACKWDSVIPLDAMWRELKRVIKPRGAIVLFAAQPFTSALVMSNAEMFRYEWIWNKKRATLFQHANRMPMRKHENICVFYRSLPTYNPQFTNGTPYIDKRTSRKGLAGLVVGHCETIKTPVDNSGFRYPVSVLEVDEDFTRAHVHPTAKDVNLLRYLVRTYTNPGETVLDFTMGSGTTGVACAMEGRHFIGVELDAGYFDIAKRRIEQVQPALMEAAD